MNLERERRAAEFFSELCELSDAERSQRLARISQQDAPLARAVEELLAHDASATEFLGQPALGAAFHLSGPYAAVGQLDEDGDDGNSQHPRAIGPYRIVELIGQGGMGVVYRAEQPRTRRQIALKVVRAGLFDARAHRFFEVEAEALGRLKHPGIARIYEAGTADFGREPVPFLVMELVEGTDLKTFVRDSKLPLRARMELVVQVCDAIHHAHQNRVIHRDIKPGNVIVTGAGRPIVVDFGLAHLGGDHDRTSFMGDRSRIMGTLPYMSPEQVDPGPSSGGTRNVDASTDVYSLGGTAYELLCGRPPFELEGLSVVAALHRVAHGHPEPLERVAPEVGRDLAAVVAKAMSHDPGDRYHSAAALAEDLQRWLSHEPVLARSIGKIEWFVSLAQRNKVLVGGGAAFVLAVIGGTISTAWQARVAHAQAKRADRIMTYVQETLAAAGDARTGEQMPIAHLLERAADGLTILQDTLIQADIASTVGKSFFDIGLYAEAEELFRDALDWRRGSLGWQAPETLNSQHQLGLALAAMGRFAQAEKHFRAAYEGRQDTLGTASEGTLASAHWLGQVLLQKEDPAEAEALFEQTWSILLRTLGEEARPTLSARERLAQVWRRQGRLDDAERALREVLAAQRRVCGPGDFDVYETLNNLATLLLDRGGIDEAETLLKEAFRGYAGLRGTEHPDTKLIEMNLAVVRGQLALAEPGEPSGVLKENLQDPRTYALLIPAAIQKFYAGRLEEARSDLAAAAEALETLGGQERYLAPARQSLASVLTELGFLAEAMTIQRDVLAAHEIAGTGRSLSALAARSALAESLRRAGDLDAALVEARRAFAALDEEAGESAIYTLSARAILAAVLADIGRLDEATGHARAVTSIAERDLGAENPFTAMFRLRLGRVLALDGQREDAQRELLAAHGVLTEKHGERGPYTLRAGRALAGLYADWGRDDDALRWRSIVEGLQGSPVEASAAPGGAAAEDD